MPMPEGCMKYFPGLWYASDPQEQVIAKRISGVLFYDYEDAQTAPHLIYFPNPSACCPILEDFVQRLGAEVHSVTQVSPHRA